MKIWKQADAGWRKVREGVYNRMLAQEGFTAISMIKFEKGAEYPLHKAISKHFGIVVKGHGVFYSGKNEAPFTEGDTFLVETDEDHRFTNTSDGELIVMEVFAPPSPRQIELAEKAVREDF